MGRDARSKTSCTGVPPRLAHRRSTPPITCEYISHPSSLRPTRCFKSAVARFLSLVYTPSLAQDLLQAGMNALACALMVSRLRPRPLGPCDPASLLKVCFIRELLVQYQVICLLLFIHNCLNVQNISKGPSSPFIRLYILLLGLDLLALLQLRQTIQVGKSYM